ncbi:MAG: type IV secretion system DNA-binding domain-containing protein [Bacteroidota bacterium]
MKSFLEDQIDLCEKFAQVGVASTALDVERLQPTLLEHSRTVQRELIKKLSCLKDTSAYMQIRIAAPTNLSPVISNLLGTLITESPGGTHDSDNGTSQFLKGGFETHVISRSLLRQAGNDLVKIKINLNLDCNQSESIQHLKYLFDPSEASCAFRFPHSYIEALLGLEERQWRVKSPQGEMPVEGVSLGVFENDTVKQVIRVSRDDRRRHMYAVGQTGTGKTTMLKSMILSDINNGEGVCVIDPHGDLFKEILGKIPKHRANDVVLIDPMDSDYPVGLNMLECQFEIQRHFIIQEMIAIITKLIEDEYGVNSIAHFAGPIFFQHLRMNMLLAMSDPGNPGTLLEFHTIYQEKNYWKRWLPLKTNEPILKRWVEEVLPQIDYTKTGSDGPSIGGYIGSKFESFLFDPLLRNIFSQKRSTIDLRHLMDERKILLVNLAKGELTETNSRFFGMVFMSKLLAATMERVKQPAANRSDFNIYIDEFQNLATQNFMTLLSEGRKFGVSLILANQFLTQVSDRIMDSIFGNVGTIITFRLGQKDAEIMGKRFSPTISENDLIGLPNWSAYVSTIRNGQPIPPFNIKTVLDNITYKEATSVMIREKSRSHFGRPRKAVEQEISQSLTNKSEIPKVVTEEKKTTISKPNKLIGNQW